MLWLIFAFFAHVRLVMGNSSSGGTGGFRVCRVAPNSPGSVANFEVFFDYIVQVGGTLIESGDQSFSDLIKVRWVCYMCMFI